MDKIRGLGLAFVFLGFVELGWVLFCVFGGLVLGAAAFIDEQFLAMGLGLGFVYGLLAVACTLIAVLHLVTGFKLRQGTGLMWVFASIAAALASLVLALYCSPLTLAVLVYAIVVIADPVARAQLDPAS